MLRVLVNGADGRMGSQVVKAVYEDKELEFVGGVSVTSIGEDCGELAGIGTLGIPVREGLAKSLEDIKPDVVVDFTIPKVIFDNAKIVMEHADKCIYVFEKTGSQHLIRFINYDSTDTA